MAPLSRLGAAAAAAWGALMAPATAQRPPEVEFIGRAPKLRIYPGGKGEGNETWIMLTFGKIQELDAQGGRVQGRSITSLASEKGIIWTQENRSIGGAMAVVTRMELPLAYGGSFKETCGGGGGPPQGDDDKKPQGGSGNAQGGGGGSAQGGGGGPPTGDDAGKKPEGGNNVQGGGGGGGGGGDKPPQGGGGGDKPPQGGGGGGGSTPSSGGGGGGGGTDKGKPARLLLEAEEDTFDSDDIRRLASLGTVAIEVFVFQADAVVDYGDYTIDVLKGQLKFNIESVGWPFCSTDHKLQVNMDIKVPGDKPPKEVKERPEEAPGDAPQIAATAAPSGSNTDATPDERPPPTTAAPNAGGDGERPPTTAASNVGNIGETPSTTAASNVGNSGETPTTTAVANGNINLDIKPEPRGGAGGGGGGGGEKKPPRGRKPKRKSMRQNAGKLDMDLDFPEAVLADNGTAACGVEVDSQGGKTSIVFTFPYFDDVLVYDPTAGFVDPDATTAAGASSAEATSAATGTTVVATSTTVAPNTTAAPEGVQTKTVVSGSLKMTVEDPAAFCADEKVIEGLRKALARASKQDARNVEVTCEVPARRLQDLRRLAGAVDVKYDITVPEGAAAPSADATVQSLAEVTPEALTTIVKEELTSVGVTVTVQVTEASAPAKQTVTYTTTSRQAATSAATRASLTLLGLALSAAAGLS